MSSESTALSHNCTNGQVFDFATKSRIPCPVCRTDRAKVVVDKSFYQEVGIVNNHLGRRFVWDEVISPGEKAFLNIEQYKTVGDELTAIYEGLSAGNPPNYSAVAGLGYKGDIEKVAYPMLAAAYTSGLQIAPLTGVKRYNRESLEEGSDLVFQLEEAQFAIVVLTEGMSKAEIFAAKGLMQERGLRGWPTLFLTTWTIEGCSALLAEAGTDDSKLLAKSLFITYAKAEKKSNYINNITGVQNTKIVGTDPVGKRFSVL